MTSSCEEKLAKIRVLLSNTRYWNIDDTLDDIRKIVGWEKEGEK